MQRPNYPSILWQNVTGDIRQKLENGSFKGIVTALVPNFGRVILTRLGPLGAAAAPLADLLKYGISVFSRSFIEYQVANYTVRTTDSGMTVLEDPQLTTPAPTQLELPPRFEIPTKSIVKPPRSLLFDPNFGSTRKFFSVPKRQTGITPVQAIDWRRILDKNPEAEPVREFASRRPGSRLRSLSAPSKPGTESIIDRTNLRPYSDIVYPKYLLGKPATGRRASPQFNLSGEDFTQSLLSNKDFLSNIRGTQTNAPPKPRLNRAEYKPGIWERFVDWIEDL
ncbi:MAG: hypothetical protein QF554_02580 [Dehalococcoidia bacterium]|jgi:hypothetical protein|nr:hypothetical protein [Dehalococcoidia bacterium]